MQITEQKTHGFAAESAYHDSAPLLPHLRSFHLFRSLTGSMCLHAVARCPEKHHPVSNAQPNLQYSHNCVDDPVPKQLTSSLGGALKFSVHKESSSDKHDHAHVYEGQHH
eukprot:jgi/Ulvmu1/10875/UM007_0051.1